MSCRAAVARRLRRSGALTAKISTAVSRRRRKLALAGNESFGFLVAHGLPPVGVPDLNLPFHRAERPGLAGGLFGANDIHDGDASSANGHRFAIFDRFDQFGQLVLGVGDTDLHEFMIAILGSYVKKAAC